MIVCCSCPFDNVKVYDGNSVSAPEIGTYCGSMHNFTIFSTGEALYVIFKTLEGRADRESYESIETPPTDQRGFLAEFTISNDFVNLSKHWTLDSFTNIPITVYVYLGLQKLQCFDLYLSCYCHSFYLNYRFYLSPGWAYSRHR